jgi:hypothetical protein
MSVRWLSLSLFLPCVFVEICATDTIEMLVLRHLSHILAR